MPTARYLKHMGKDERKRWLTTFDVVFFDCDGVIWLCGEAIPGTGLAINQLKIAGKKCFFIDNNSIRSDSQYIDKLMSLGVKDVDSNHVMHPAKIITRYLRANNYRKPIFSLGSPQFNRVVSEAGFLVKTVKPHLHLKKKDLLTKIRMEGSVGAVLLDLNLNITYNQLATAQQYLMDEGCNLIVGATDTLIPFTKTFNSIGTAGFQNILLELSGKTPVILGKPSPLFCNQLIEQFNIAPERVLLIGDSLEIDIAMGKKNRISNNARFNRCIET